MTLLLAALNQALAGLPMDAAGAAEYDPRRG
jgi:hypothetical protein